MDLFSYFIINDQTITTFYYIAGCSFVLMFFIAASNTIVIYEDYSDFYLSLGIILFPILLLVGQFIIAPPLEMRPAGYDIYFENSNHKIITGIGILGTLATLIVTLVNSVKSNGTMIGIIVFLFKIISCGISVILIIGVIAGIFMPADNQKKRSRTVRSLLVALVVFKVLQFFIKKLVNGERVRKKRQYSKE